MSCGEACAALIRSPTTLMSNEALRLAQCRSGQRRGGGCIGGAPDVVVVAAGGHTRDVPRSIQL
jgi:hypothetical protein